ncbi:hypothetical protein L484_013995 [Morus notabilis]|uniref:Uncharacterized protein n=1 Tax=Morus notabilis TaxID=981085 RepID=W9QTU8_9ROSA|nr:hypothetical protein L484_013995 [Morus notabilis]
MHAQDDHLFRQYEVDLPVEDIKGEQEGQQGQQHGQTSLLRSPFVKLAACRHCQSRNNVKQIFPSQSLSRGSTFFLSDCHRVLRSQSGGDIASAVNLPRPQPIIWFSPEICEIDGRLATIFCF